jgi:carboxyl-terminal processing protease
MAGDLITKIDDKPTKGMSLNDAVKLMRGAPKSPITLTIMRASNPQPIVLRIMRDVIKVRSVRSKMLEGDVAYVRIAQFQEKTGVDLAKQLTDLGAKQTPKAIVLDLRNDPGGLLTSAIGVAGAFLPSDSLVVSTDGRTPDARHKYLADPSEFARGETNYLAGLPAWVKTVPMVVLVNVGSASASEIVAGALQDHKRAKVMGNRTFGKGSVQVILPLTDDTAVKLTTSRYFTPSGRSIQATGIEPDVVVADTAEGDLFRLPREADLQHHLSNPLSGTTEIKSDPNAATEDAQQLPNKAFEFGGNDDFQLKQALNQLAGRPIQKATPKPASTADAAKSGSSDGTTRLTITPNGVEPSKQK